MHHQPDPSTREIGGSALLEALQPHSYDRHLGRIGIDAGTSGLLGRLLRLRCTTGQRQQKTWQTHDGREP
jgi:hypothetical protein